MPGQKIVDTDYIISYERFISVLVTIPFLTLIYLYIEYS